MSEIDRVGDDVQASLEVIANRVMEILGLAGLNVVSSNRRGDEAGAEVEVDLGADAAGGVYVVWHPDRRLAGKASESVMQERFDDPIIKLSGSVGEAMKLAISAILTSAGFQICEPSDDMRPLSVQVLAGPSKTPWA